VIRLIVVEAAIALAQEDVNTLTMSAAMKQILFNTSRYPNSQSTKETRSSNSSGSGSMVELEKNASATESATGVSARVGSVTEYNELAQLGYKPELRRNRSMLTLLFQSLAIAAIPYGEGGPL
jgi:hypothetical protein